ncbi:MAG: Holliday junction branch migration protein RuvA [Chitinophagaceae bacterium]|nr:Holliday junction branch migration protein RuvA [Chitinophagaceae bacterium]MBP6046908.1 Holliday junction branch migration protein RuvA [Ferruginibacter sp.]MBK7089488.1 Holliday junction branch migration protein RuvA [Chitinophagaceae bacterium]MBK7347214.1 Holliday junction branch migration protein RuvA [Chitinophagaceae bacterium]MBK8774973.1 Holliday junction branch migration protein RuvA [Chitinophagaceae bacterium]
MIAYLEGRLAFKSPALLHLDVNGIGYEVNISLHTYSAIQSLEKVKLYTYLQVKEDAHTLYGFFEPQEKEIFVLLISVSGVGAATARMMLSSLKPKEIVVAILVGNSKALEAIKGIGKKTAERLVLELRDKVQRHENTGEMPTTSNNTMEYDALNALTALGIPKSQAEQALKKVASSQTGELQLEDLIKKALKAI